MIEPSSIASTVSSSPVSKALFHLLLLEFFKAISQILVKFLALVVNVAYVGRQERFKLTGSHTPRPDRMESSTLDVLVGRRLHGQCSDRL